MYLRLHVLHVMVETTELPDITAQILERPNCHVTRDRTGVDRMVQLAWLSGDVCVDANDVRTEPEDGGYRRSYVFEWSEPGVLTYRYTQCNHGGAPVKKYYPCPEVIADLLRSFFDGMVSVESDEGFNQAHEN